jgi:hypothetical protein
MLYHITFNSRGNMPSLLLKLNVLNYYVSRTSLVWNIEEIKKKLGFYEFTIIIIQK